LKLFHSFVIPFDEKKYIVAQNLGSFCVAQDLCQRNSQIGCAKVLALQFKLNYRKDYQMIGYITLGTNELQRACAFYDLLMAEFGAVRTMDYPTFIAWGTSPESTALSVIKPYDGNPASVDNGVMVGLQADSRATVDCVYNKAMSLGAKDEDPAGPRGDTFYAGYFPDPDGNKLNVFYAGE